MQTSVTLSAPVFSSLSMVVRGGGGFLLFCIRKVFFPGLFRNAEGFGFSVFWSLACLGLGLRFFEVAPHFDGIGDRTFCSGIDNVEDVVFMRLFSLMGENLQR